MSDSIQVEKLIVMEAYTKVFVHSDAHQWEEVKLCFDETLTLDYSSLTGQPPSIINRDDLVAAWSAFLPKFTFTLHYLSNHVVSIDGDTASSVFYGHAIHQLKGAAGGDFWEVYGTYRVDLRKRNSRWVVTCLKYNHKYASGNLNLPELASR